MRLFHLLRALAGLVLLAVASLAASKKTVAITVDDLPYAGGNLTPPLDSKVSAAAKIVNRKLLAAFQLHRVPVTGFVIERRVESLGLAKSTGLLRDWVRRGFYRTSNE
jgi:hypothetical protein